MSAFSGLSTALSALRYNRVAMDVATDGYTRREHGSQSYLDLRRSVLERVESGLGEPGDTGVAAAIADFRSAWHDLANNPGSDAARSAVLGRAATLTDAIRIQARNIEGVSGDQRFRIQADVAEVNTLAGVLLDNRDQLALRLSELTGATATCRPDGGFNVSVNGVLLVVGQRSGSLNIAAGITAAGASDGSPITFAITDTTGTTAVPGGITGEIGGLTDLLNTTLPAYTAGLDAIAQQLADETNAQHQAGYDAAGNPGQPFFSCTPGSAASSIAVALTAPAVLAASAIPGGGLDATNATAMASATGVEASYQRLVHGFGTEVASVTRLAAHQQALTSQDSVLDTLITRTGVTPWILQRPSDSPTDTTSAMRIRSSLADVKQYTRNAGDGNGWLSRLDAALTSATDQVLRARDLARQGAHQGVAGQTAREAMAADVDQIRGAMIDTANTDYLGRPVFGGITAGAEAYDPTGTYVGTTGAVNRTVSAGSTIRVDVDGRQAFGATGSSVFDHLATLSVALRAGDQVGIRAGITALGADRDRITTAQSDVGTRQIRVEAAIQAADDNELKLKTSLSEVENADLSQVVVDLQLQQTAYQASLAATARVMQPSLLDFLR